MVSRRHRSTPLLAAVAALALAVDASAQQFQNSAGIIPGLENELEGKAAGDSFSATVTPADGFGEVNPELIQKIPLTSFPDPGQLQPGMQIEGTGTESGQVTRFVVREIDDEHVTLDSNHPLAGLTLCFEGVIEDVRQASDEEIRQGQPL